MKETGRWGQTGFSASVVNNSHTQSLTADLFYQCGPAGVTFTKEISVAGPDPTKSGQAKIGRGTKNHYIKNIDLDVQDIQGGATTAGITLTTGFRLDSVVKNSLNEAVLKYRNTAQPAKDHLSTTPSR
ncbi:hypothetical protein [Streptomyces sp. ODS05-4]|uniref:hypothetical protein n=1 Tax=Streptomyces sp. ODS05-4 TaxID=2944939 RepID=UPI00210A00A8|nr:hypothetical protein [Streptomyces sp. ODS05-4]